MSDDNSRSLHISTIMMNSDGEDIAIPVDNSREGVKVRDDVPVSSFIPESMYRERLQENPQEIAAKWLELYQTSPPGVAMRAIKEQIRLFVPMIYSPMKNCDCLNLTYDEDLAYQKLFGPMELFLSGFEKRDAFFKKLEALEPPATLCGRVFKHGEPTYSCRDCGMDPTCVLCVDCFKVSAHKHHKYKISTSNGGGYCDCGDDEAWKTNFYCDAHVPKYLNQSENSNENADLEDIQRRARTLFHFALEFCHEMLTSDLHTVLPRELTLQEFEIELLSIPCSSDTFGTVLYNDESHTFDFVIQTLNRAVECSKKIAQDYATMIDREGRSLVKCANFQTCNQVKQIIERQTSRNGGKPLKVMVMQSYVLAHQTFSIQLLNWIQKLVNLSSYYRKAFCTAITMLREKSDIRPGYSILEGVMLSDVNLWKSVRSLWHHLAISGLLKEYDTKRSFAVTFSKLYPELVKDFIDDDHDHQCSIASLSVQIFTVPTIAHHLIDKEDIFFKIIQTFMSECEQRLNSERVLEFDRNIERTGLKRANYCLTDLKYILTSAPNVWDEGLRRGFLHGFSSFLVLLSWMENMDTVVRQTLQHMEYEPEWEAGFNLHLKLSPAISLLLEWCGSDKTILIVAYRKTMLELNKIYGNDKTRTSSLREYANHSATCIDYDVSRQPVSVHKPLSRFFAGLYLHLEKFNLHFFSQELTIEEKLSPEILIEPALRTQVLVGQVHANMWRRNGFALLNQMYFYHNVRCRSDMLDKDIISLQMGAAIIESNEFILHVLDRYGLFQWANTTSTPADGFNEDDNQKNIRHLVEEFLHLIIVLFSARFTPGVAQVTKEDCIKKEVIQQLCIEPMTHSNLNKNLVENVNMETGLETVIDQVALFKKQSTQNGLSVYELKPELFDEYDCFYYHYTKEEQSKAEQRQQSRKKTKGEPEFFPPPKLPLFTNSFDVVVNILRSDVFLTILNLILRRECICLQLRSSKNVKSWDSTSVTYSDPQIQKVLHLICLGLNEEIVRNEREPGHFFRFYESAKPHGIFCLLEEYIKVAVNSSHIEMGRYILKLCEVANPPSSKEEIPKEIEIVANVNEEEEKQKKAKLAAESRMKMLAKISAAQKSFMAVNADLFAEEETGVSDNKGELCSSTMQTDSDTLQALGVGRTASNYIQEEVHVCILCQEEQSLSDLSKPFVLAAYVQRSSVMCQDQARLTAEAENQLGNFFLQERDALFLGPDLLSAPVVSCCGHMMHVSCWNKHYENVQAKERRRPYRHLMSFDVEKREYLCPMCDCISNIVMPLTNPLFKLYSSSVPTKQIPGPFDVWIEGLQVFAKERSTATNLPIGTQDVRHRRFCTEESNNAKKYETCSLDNVLTKLEHRSSEFQSDFLIPPSSYKSQIPKFTDNFQELVTNFTQTVFAIGLDVKPDLEDYRLPLMLWQGLSFSIIALEEYSRDQNQAFFGCDVPSRRELGITHYIRTCAVGTLQYFTSQPDVIRSHAIKLVTTLVTSPAELPCILECDAFSMLISLTHAMPALSPETVGLGYLPSTGTMFDFFICRLTFLFHITQVLITKDFSEYIHTPEPQPSEGAAVEIPSDGWEEMDDKETSSSPKASPALSRMEHLFSEVWRSVGKTLPKDAIVDYDAVWESIRISVIPFLRCCCKFYEKLTGVSPPDSLTNPVNSYDDLVTFLGLPISFEKLFDSRICWQLPYRWASHPGVLKLLSPTVLRRIPEECRRIAVVSYPRRPVTLAPLPHDYMELMNSVTFFTCSFDDTHDSRAPTMCLICGAILCSQCYSCQYELIELSDTVVGACTYHAYYCGGGKGIFLRIRDCKLFYINGKGRGCYMLPPYVDEYGETDQGLRRGNPMTLDIEKYEQFRRSWMLHLIPEEIARLVENATSITVTEWHFL